LIPASCHHHLPSRSSKGYLVEMSKIHFKYPAAKGLHASGSVVVVLSANCGPQVRSFSGIVAPYVEESIGDVVSQLHDWKDWCEAEGNDLRAFNNAIFGSRAQIKEVRVGGDIEDR
jgi:hypothetical protein